MRYLAGACLLIFAASIFSIATKAHGSDEPPHSIDILENLISREPLGLGPRCGAGSEWESSRNKKQAEGIIALADKVLSDGYASWSDDAYLEFSRNGTRVSFERIILDRNTKLHQLAIAACVTGSQKYKSTLDELLTSIANQPTWTLSATDRNLESFRGKFFVDLNVAEMGGEIGQILYLLRDYIAPDVWRRTANAIEQRLINPIFEQLQRGRGPFWLYEPNNWNAVCLSGFVTAVLTTSTSIEKRAKAISLAYEHTRVYLTSFDQEGYATEGMTYWGYGFSRYALLRAYVLRATFGATDFYSRPNVRAIAAFPHRFQMSLGSTAAFGDSQLGQRPDAFTMIYVNNALKIGLSYLPSKLPINSGSVRFTSLALFEEVKLTPDAGKHPETYPLPLHDFFSTAATLVGRPAQNQKANNVAYTLKASSGGTHSHDDIGSFAVTYCGKQVMGDPGWVRYYSADLSKRREMKIASSYGHPVPSPDGDLQTTSQGSRAPIDLILSESSDRIRVDLRNLYLEARPVNLTRNFFYDRTKGIFAVRDEFKLLAPGSFDSPVITSLEFSIADDRTIALGPHGEAGKVTISSSFSYEFNIEKIEKNGLAFSRIGLRSRSPVTEGWIEYSYSQPAASCPSQSSKKELPPRNLDQ